MTERGEQLISLAENRGEQLNNDRIIERATWFDKVDQMGGGRKITQRKAFTGLSSPSQRADVKIFFSHLAANDESEMSRRDEAKDETGGGIVHQL